MSDRDKLIELLLGAYRKCWSNSCEDCEYRDERITARLCQSRLFADHLRDHGVTFATDTNVGSEWVSVEDRLPEKEGWYLVFTTPNRGYKSINKGEFYFYDYEGDNSPPKWRGAGGTWTNVTHWMPLPSTEGIK